MKFQGIQQMKAILAAVALGIVLAGCSAGGKPADTKGGISSAASLNVSTSKSALSSTGSDSATVTVTALDSNNNVVAAAPVTISADSGVVTTSATSTDTSGVVIGTIGVGGDHSNRSITLVVKSGSLRKTVTIDVTGATLGATAASTTAGSSATIQYTLLDAANVAIAGASITVSMAGQADATGTTDANGKYPYPFTMPSTSSTVTAKAAGVTSTTTVSPTNGTTVVPDAGTVTSPSLAANPSSVSTGHQVELRALFIGANNAPIPNVRVRFLMTDNNSIGGTLSSDSADGLTHNVVYSDANGVARATYTAGTRGGIIIPTICWKSTDFASGICPNTVSASSLTVVASGVSLAVLTNGIITVDNANNNYSLSLVVQVVDASNQPVAGSKVTGGVDIPRYYRGAYGISNAKWVPGLFADPVLGTGFNPVVESCDNEDINRNNNMEAAEDHNGSNALEPFKASVAIVPTSAGSDVTDSFGKAHFSLQYGQNYASWEDTVLTFTTTVEGTEGHATYPTGLPVPAASLTTITSSPPFQTSPYNVLPDGEFYPTYAGSDAFANPGVIYFPAISSFNLCRKQS
jgi:protocatechuate 3,4-dioxygenase beta subunit